MKLIGKGLKNQESQSYLNFLAVNLNKARFKAYQENSNASVGGKENTWRRVDLCNMPKAAPYRDMFELIEKNQIRQGSKSGKQNQRNWMHFLMDPVSS
jgi:hypothetical protein